MITTRVIPVSTATSQNLLVEIIEPNLCNPYCVNNQRGPSASVSFSVAGVRVVDGTAIATIIATTTINSPTSCACGCAKTQVFNEAFDVAFTATATNLVTLTPGTEVSVDPSNVRCCMARGARVTTTLTVTIA
ncbi:MAG: hypothetical protein MJZ30_09380 [Paludibacteraceae bacterium]|nr:hypothetical protein [Paludibacteraceae bacterium]